jgi:hypothetical protein
MSHLVFLNTKIRNDDMKLRLISLISASSLLLIWLLALPAWATEYRLEVTDLD